MIECNRGVMDVKSFLNLADSLLQIAMEVRVRVCYNTVVLKIKNISSQCGDHSLYGWEQ